VARFPGATGWIPDFAGAPATAARAASLAAWQAAGVSACHLAGPPASPARAGRRIGVAELHPVDLVVCGSVAVNREGARVGKEEASRTWSSRCWSRPA
jgi:hypothetical protein